MTQCHVQCHACAHRIAAQRDWLVGQQFGDQIGGLVKRRVDLGGVAVSGQVECPQLVGTCQNGAELVRGSARLGETVQPHEGRAGTLALDPEE